MQFNSLQASFILSPIQGTEDTEMSHSQSLYSKSSKSNGKDSPHKQIILDSVDFNRNTWYNNVCIIISQIESVKCITSTIREVLLDISQY